MDFIDKILTRRSIRKYSSQQVTQDQINTLLKAAMYAPSAVNKQPWHFIIFDNEKTIEKIVEVHPNSGMMRTASTNILVCWDENLEHDKGYGIQDCSAAIQNILLAAHAMELGTCWIGIHPREERKLAVKEIFNLPASVQPLAVISIGYPDEEKTFPDRFKPERIHYNKW